jgi:hypothetical protein
MNMALILSAVHQGATVANYVSVIDLHKGPDGKLNGARLRDELTGEEWSVKAKVSPVRRTAATAQQSDPTLLLTFLP